MIGKEETGIQITATERLRRLKTHKTEKKKKKKTDGWICDEQIKLVLNPTKKRHSRKCPRTQRSVVVQFLEQLSKTLFFLCTPMTPVLSLDALW